MDKNSQYRKKHIIDAIKSAILIFLIVFTNIHLSTVNQAVAAENVNKEIESSVPSDYSNVKSIGVDVFGSCKTSFININEQGYQMVVYKDKLYIEQYDKQWNRLWSKTLELELPIWGGYYCGTDYNFVVCGQNRNGADDNGGEVYRIIKYDKDFKRIASCSLKSNESYTIIPFDAGEVSIDENYTDLVVYTSRLRLDGHQSNIRITIDKENMTLKERIGVNAFPEIHVSHSFRQIVRYDNDKLVYADLSDGYPHRSIYLQSAYVNSPMLEIEGDDGDNVTNADLTGLGISDDTYIVTGTYLHNNINNVYVSCVSKATGEVTGTWITDCNVYNSNIAYAPRIIQISDNRYVLMWGTQAGVDYIIMDKNTTVLSGKKSIIGARITDCEPVYADGNIIWVTYIKGKMTVNKINDFGETGSYSPKIPLKDSCDEWDGSYDISWYSDSQDEFHICNPQQMAGFAELVNSGNTFAGKKIYMDNDIYLNKTYSDDKYEWIPIAYSKDDDSDNELEFNGLFDGNGHNIYNMYVASKSDKKGGLFGNIGEKGKVQYINIVQSIMMQNCSIALNNYGYITGCTNDSFVYGIDERVGGICRVNNGRIIGCHNNGRIDGDGAGGIVSTNVGVILQCSNKGYVLGGLFEPGGIAELNIGYIENCYNSGIVSDNVGLNSERGAAGIVWSNSSNNSLYNCYNNGMIDISSKSEFVFGAFDISFNSTQNKKCFTTTDIYKNDNTQIIKDKNELLISLNNGMDEEDMWYDDEWNINSGMPITMPEYYMQKGVKPYEGINIEDNILYGMLSGTKVSDLIYKLLGSADIKGDDGNILSENDIIATGNKVKVTTKDNMFYEYTISIKGDVDGSGTIDVLDMEAIQKSILGIGSELTGAYKKAALLSDDSKEISVLDMEAIQKDILGIEKIN